MDIFNGRLTNHLTRRCNLEARSMERQNCDYFGGRANGRNHSPEASGQVKSQMLVVSDHSSK